MNPSILAVRKLMPCGRVPGSRLPECQIVEDPSGITTSACSSNGGRSELTTYTLSPSPGVGGSPSIASRARVQAGERAECWGWERHTATSEPLSSLGR